MLETEITRAGEEITQHRRGEKTLLAAAVWATWTHGLRVCTAPSQCPATLNRLSGANSVCLHQRRTAQNET